MKAGHFSNLAALTADELQQRRTDAEQLLSAAREHKQRVEVELIEGAAERAASGDPVLYEAAERAVRVAALRVSDAERVLQAVDVAIGAAQDRATAEAGHRALLVDLPARREQLRAELERAQAKWAEAKEIFDGPGSWCSIELPHKRGSKAKLTLIGETRWAAVRGAHADCERIKGELAELDALEQAEVREAA